MERVKAAGRENERTEGLRIGIDVGGTFTDLVAIDGTGTLRRCKVFSTPEDPSSAVLAGLEQLLGATATDAGGAEAAGGTGGLRAGVSIVHGSTIATNAVLERKGARTALVATRGFRDLLKLGRQDRPDLFDFESRRPEPLASAELCFEVSGRVDHAGVELEPLDESDLPELIDRLRSGGAESVAVCLLFSFARPEHEASVGRALRGAGFHVSLSSEVLPEFREYERASTTALNAYVGPILDRYLGRLQERLPAGTLRIMLSNGGSAGVEAARREAVRSILSGPAAGVVGALRVARAAGSERILSFDMGGTSTDVALLDGGVPFTSEGAIAGLPVRVPMVDIHTVGSGGGSIARVDAGGALRVGPESAGAVPGPVCYGRGGKQPAVTDANVVLGRLPPDRFLAGAVALDADAALAALAELGREAGLETSGMKEADLARRAALGVVRVANVRMERALREISAERGRDPEDFTLVSFGGAGGLHACDLARGLGIRRVLVPPSASVLSAFGMLAADVLKDYVQTVMQPGDAALADVEAVAAGLEKRGRSEVAAEGIAPHQIFLRRELDVRYEGQAFEVAVPLSPDFVGLFHAEHERLYGHSDPAAPVQVVNVRVRAIGQVKPPPLEEEAEDAEGQAPVELDRRPVVLGQRPDSEAGLDVREAAVLEHGALRPGHRLAGPAIVVSTDTTLYLGPSDRARVDGYGNLLIEVGTEPSANRPNRKRTNRVLSERSPNGCVDPVRLEVYRHLLASIAEEMGAVLQRSAFSPNIKERRDYSCAVFDARAEMAALAAHIPVHLGAMPLSVAGCLASLELGPGDVAILNDPYRGGSHLPDITLVAPVFAEEGELLGFLANRAHHADVGGATPGSMGLASELSEEGVLIPPRKLVRGGMLDVEVRDLLLDAVRTPEERAGDLRAQLASVRRGVRRLQGMSRRYGRLEMARYMLELIAYTERVARRFIASLPDGEYRFEDALDDDGVSEGPVPIAVALRIRGEEAEVDFTGTASQRPSSVNAPYAVAVSATYYVFRALLGENVPSNGGILRSIRVVAPEGSVVNPRPPAAVAAGNVETSQRITDVLLGALARAVPGRVPAASQGTMNNVTVGGWDPARKSPYAYYETIAGGAGASCRSDGSSATHTHMTNTLNTPVEALEYAYPLHVLRYEVRRGSGGAGRHRGGDGVRRDIRVTGAARACILSDRRRLFPYGLEGGGGGSVGRNVLIRDGEERELPGKICLDLEAGDVLSIRTPGGGGFGAA